MVFRSNTHNCSVSIPENVDDWYLRTFFQPTRLGHLFGKSLGKSLRDPKIFAILRPRDAYRYAALDGWRRAMWHDGGLPRRTREAIAVAVSAANQCHY